MKLNVMERILLLQALPAEGDLITLRIVRDLKNNLSFTEKEHKDFGITQIKDNTSWTNGGDADIQIGEKATDIIVESLTKLNKENKLTVDHISICDKFKVEA